MGSDHMSRRSKPYINGCEAGYQKKEAYTTIFGKYIPAKCYPTNMKPTQTRRKAKVPSIRSLVRGDCPPGKVLRRGYVRRYSSKVRKEGITVHRMGKSYKVYPKAKTASIKASCIKGTASAKKTKSKIGPLRKGELTRLGYSSRIPDEKRHAALKKAVAVYSALGVYRKLDAVAKLTVHSLPTASAIYAKDRDWIRATFGPLKAI